jgi:hypothetical protein
VYLLLTLLYAHYWYCTPVHLYTRWCTNTIVLLLLSLLLILLLQTRQGLTIDVPDYVEGEECSGDCSDDCSSGSAERERDSSEERRRHGSSTDTDNDSSHHTSTDSSSEAAEVRYIAQPLHTL